MRDYVWLLVLLAFVGWLATEVPLPETPAAADRPSDCWRRTPDGWQRATWLARQTPARRPALHPGVVGLFELLATLAALVAFPSGAAPTDADHDCGRHADSHPPTAAPGPPTGGPEQHSRVGLARGGAQRVGSGDRRGRGMADGADPTDAQSLSVDAENRRKPL